MKFEIFHANGPKIEDKEISTFEELKKISEKYKCDLIIQFENRGSFPVNTIRIYDDYVE